MVGRRWTVNNVDGDGKPAQHSITKSVVLHLFPGAAAVAFFVVVGIPVARAFELSSAQAFLLTSLVVLLPIELGYLLYIGRKTNGKASLKGLVLYVDRISTGNLALLVAVCLFISVLRIVLVPLDEALFETLFSWVPDWFLIDIDPDEYSRPALIGTYAALIAIQALRFPWPRSSISAAICCRG